MQMEVAMRAFSLSMLRRPATLPLRALLRRAALWRALARERRALATLDPHMLRDMGISEGDAAREAARPFWDAPEGR